MTNEERAAYIAEQANECCNRSDGYEENIKKTALTLLDEACSQARGPRRWEYRVEQIPHRDGTYSASVHIHPDDFQALLTRMGAQGWELCETSTGSIIVFKRPMAEG